jgi:hypothetical protein
MDERGGHAAPPIRFVIVARAVPGDWMTIGILGKSLGKSPMEPYPACI